MNEFSDTELLQQLLDGELSAGSRELLLEKIEKDPALKNEWDTLRLSREALRLYGRKKQIQGIHAEMMAELGGTGATPSVTRVRTIGAGGFFRKSGLRVAAALFILFMAVGLYPYFSATPQSLFDNNYHAYAPASVRGTESLNGIAALYHSADWKALTADYRSLASPGAEEAFLAGNAYLELKDPQAAVKAFGAVKKANERAGTHFFEPDTDYYLALALLADVRPAAALPLFERIYADAAHPYHDKVSWWLLQKVRRLATR